MGKQLPVDLKKSQIIVCQFVFPKNDDTKILQNYCCFTLNSSEVIQGATCGKAYEHWNFVKKDYQIIFIWKLSFSKGDKYRA